MRDDPQEAKSRDLVPITTEKDRVRLSGAGEAAARLIATSETFPVRVRFEEPRRLKTLIVDALAGHASAYRHEPVTYSAETVPA